MKTLESSYINALLADASYIAVRPDMTATDLFNATKDRLTETQANYLAANFEVVSSIESAKALGSGFDAVVWRVKAGSPLAVSNPSMEGQVFVSMRGTQGAEDIADDAALAASGVPISQIVDMVNWWLRITAPVTDGNVAQIRYSAETVSYELAAPVAGTGELAGVSAIAAVNGHSLGGYLATAFARIFGNQASVQAVNTFNSAGFSNAAALNISNHFDQIASLLGCSGSFTAVGAIQNNYFGENGIEFTTNSLGDMRLPGFNQYGSRIGLYQEAVLSGGADRLIANHYMYKLTDYLALGAALEKLDPSLGFDKLAEFVKTGSNDMKASYEGVLDALRKIIGGANVAPLDADDVSGNAPTREGFYAALKALQENPTFKALTGQLTLKSASLDLRAQARNSFAALVALQDLSPIVIGGKDAAANAQLDSLWQSTRADDYAAWQADKTSATPSTFTDQWIQDRAVLLEAIVARNTKDGTSNAYSSALPTDRVYDLHWIDANGNAQVLFAENTNRTNGVLAPVAHQQIWFGGADADELTGSDINQLGDHLYGGAGADTLKGLGGNDFISGEQYDDWLYGGEGNDAIWGGVCEVRYTGRKRRIAIYSRATHAGWTCARGQFDLQGFAANDARLTCAA